MTHRLETDEDDKDSSTKIDIHEAFPSRSLASRLLLSLSLDQMEIKVPPAKYPRDTMDPRKEEKEQA